MTNPEPNELAQAVQFFAALFILALSLGFWLGRAWHNSRVRALTSKLELYRILCGEKRP
jgi:hypothetical protein